MFTRRLRYILQHNYVFVILLVMALIYCLVMTRIVKYQSSYSLNTEMIWGEVIDYKIKNDKLTLTLVTSNKERVVANYYIKKGEQQIITDMHLGDIYQLTGVLSVPSNNTVPNTFNYREYLYNKHIYVTMKVKRLEKVKSNEKIGLEIKNMVLKRIRKMDKTGYLRAFILGNTGDISKEVIDSYQGVGVSYLFAISGMHISLIAGLLLKFFKRIFYHPYMQYGVVILCLFLYGILIGMGPSVIRTLIMFMLLTINRLGKWKIKKINLMILVLVITIFYDPFMVYQIGYQFSYINSVALVVCQERINRHKSYWVKSLLIAVICFIVSFPLCVYHFYQVNILSVLASLILSPLVSLVIFPLSLVCFVIPLFLPLLELGVGILEMITRVMDGIEITKIVFMKIPLIVVCLYYILFVLILYNYKFIMLLLLLVICHKGYPYINPNMIVTVMDVGQGDSTLIVYPHNQGNILVDTGGNINNKEYRIVVNKTIPYLKSLGISKLDYLITTHGDYDHMGESINLVNHFKVDKVILNNGEVNNLERDLIKVLNDKKIGYVQGLQELKINYNQQYFLNNKVYDNENDNSNVLYFNYNGYKFLLMGDASTVCEKDIMERYEITDIDFLKVGHHGSDTSSSKSFINRINPQYGLISVGKNNRYGHPKKKVLETLSKSKVYRTDIDGSIVIKLKRKGYEIRTYSP